MNYRLMMLFLSCYVTVNLQAENLDQKNSFIISPGLGSTITTQQPVIIGIVKNTHQKPAKNKAVRICLDDKKIVAIVKTNKDGVWSYRLSSAQSLTNGFHTLQASIQASLANIFWMQGTMFLVDATDECKTSYKSGNVYANNSAFNFPFDGSYINTARPTVVGTLLDSNFDPVTGETVTIIIDNNTIGSAVSDNNGVFSLTLPSSLSNGSHTLDAHCVESNVDLARVTCTIDTVSPAAPTITSPSTLAIVSGSFTVTGTSEPYATIETYLDNDPYGQIGYADETGAWSVDYTASTGVHSLTARATDLAGNQSASTLARIFTVVSL